MSGYFSFQSHLSNTHHTVEVSSLTVETIIPVIQHLLGDISDAGHTGAPDLYNTITSALFFSPNLMFLQAVVDVAVRLKVPAVKIKTLKSLDHVIALYTDVFDKRYITLQYISKHIYTHIHKLTNNTKFKK